MTKCTWFYSYFNPFFKTNFMVNVVARRFHVIFGHHSLYLTYLLRIFGWWVLHFNFTFLCAFLIWLFVQKFHKTRLGLLCNNLFFENFPTRVYFESHRLHANNTNHLFHHTCFLIFKKLFCHFVIIVISIWVFSPFFWYKPPWTPSFLWVQY